MIDTIALIAGCYLLVTGTGFLLQPQFYKSMVMGQGTTDPVTLNLSGACHFVIGMIVLTNVGSLASFEAGAVTLLGAAATLKGAFLIALPETASRSPQATASRMRGTGISFVAAGLLFLWIALF